jgi:hypothetical protein
LIDETAPISTQKSISVQKEKVPVKKVNGITVPAPADVGSDAATGVGAIAMVGAFAAMDMDLKRRVWPKVD